MTTEMKCGPCRTCARWIGIRFEDGSRACGYLTVSTSPDFGCVRWVKHEPEITPEQVRRVVELLRTANEASEGTRWWPNVRGILREIDGEL